MTLRISIHSASTQPDNLYRVLTYAELPKAFGYTTKDKPSKSNFEYIQLWIPGIGTGSISTYCQLTLNDYVKHRNMQEPNGNKTLAEIMNWLYGSILGGGMPTRPYWWATATDAHWGVVVFGNQLVQVLETRTMRVKYPNGSEMVNMPMGRIATFKRTDWGKTYHTHPWLVQKGTAAHWNGSTDVHVENPGGAPHYSPIWDPQEFEMRPAVAGVVPEYWCYLDTLQKVQ